MTTYTINYTQAEELAMQYESLSVDEWIQNAAHERARIAIEEIVAITVQKCLETNIQIPGTREAIVELAFDNEWVKTAAERQADAIAQAPNNQ
jgi:P2-related tail formation protein